MATKKALLELGNRFLKANKKAGKLRKEFEALLLQHCGLIDMPDDDVWQIRSLLGNILGLI